MAKRVFSLETERDKDLDVLAATLADCRHKLGMDRCKLESCKSCERMYNIAICMKELPACDKLRVWGTADAMYARLSYHWATTEQREKVLAESKREDVKGRILLGVGMIGAVIIGCAILPAIMGIITLLCRL